VTIPASSCVVPNLVVSVLDSKEPMGVREIVDRVRRIHGCGLTYQSIRYHLAKLRRKGGVAYVPNRGWVRRIVTVSFEEAVTKLTRA
jgi:DNA-binding transcriptional ArsR family regulator